MEGAPILLIDGGRQKRCFTDVSDGVECLYRIIENNAGICDGRIINIGDPDNEVSIRGLAELLLAKFEQHPLRSKFPPFAGFRLVESSSYYGKGYQDVQYRRPSIRNAKKLLNWAPIVDLEHSVEQTLDFFLRTGIESREFLLVSESKLSVPHKIVEMPHGSDKKPLESKVHENRLED